MKLAQLLTANSKQQTASARLVRVLSDGQLECARQPKVSEFKVAGGVNQDVLRLQVAM